jgi:ABC-type uncharacterized transport system fused permease/ATPase subunit
MLRKAKQLTDLQVRMPEILIGGVHVNKLRQFWSSLRSSFWFMPSLMVAISITLAIVLVEADSAGLNQWLNQWPRLFGVGAEGARLMLSTLAGSMMTVMGITFSMTLLALVLASGQYTSRILRNFMRNRVTQESLDERTWYPVPAAESGYVLSVNNNALLRTWRVTTELSYEWNTVSARLLCKIPLWFRSP